MSKPKIRFKGFEDEWTPDYASNIFSSICDKGHPDLPVLSATQDRGMIIRDESEKIVLHNKANEIGYKRVVPGQFVIHLRSFQGGFAHSDVEGITSPAYTVMGLKNPELHSDYFWKIVFSSKEFINRLKAVTYGIRDGRSISYDDFLELSFSSPSSTEQYAIAKFFKKTSDYISILQDKIASLKSLKICYLNRLFPIGGGYEPPIRLAGFSGEWKRVKLADLLTIREDTAGENFSKEDVLSVSGECGVVNQIEFQGRSFAGASISNYRVVNTGNVVYTKSPLKASPYGIIKTAKEQEGIVSPLYAVYNPNDTCDADFIQTYFENKDRLNDYLRPLVNKGAKNTLLISDDGALQGEVVVPSKEEQQAISNFFNELDQTIRLHEEELEKLKALKESCLQGMFV